MFSIKYKLILLLTLFSTACSTFGVKPHQMDLSKAHSSKMIEELIIETPLNTPDFYAEEIQEYLEEELKVLKKSRILDSLDKNEVNLSQNFPRLYIDIKKKSNSPFIKFLGLGIIPTWEKNEMNIQVRLFKNDKEIANWSFNQKSVSWYSIWFLPWISQYDPSGKVVLKNAIHNIVSDILKDNLL